MTPSTQWKPNISSDGEMESPDYFFVPVFRDKNASAELLGPMPTGAARKQRLPQAVPAYWAALWNVPLLNAEQEQHCFRKLNFLKYLSAHADRLARSDIGCTEMLDDRKRFDRQSVQVRNQIVEANLRLVISLAKKYASAGSNEFDEIVCIGNASLPRAVDLFDFRRPVRFSTYAYQAVQSAIFGAYRKERRFKNRFISCGNEATESAVADAGESDFAELRALEARCQVIDLMNKLDERERRIVMARFGINRKQDGVAFHVIAKDIGLSTTRTIQLFRRSLSKMRASLAPQEY
ncbi:MAG: sigma-70 family RNA polymerase sigma factor [Rubripirellula sp.]